MISLIIVFIGAALLIGYLYLKKGEILITTPPDPNNRYSNGSQKVNIPVIAKAALILLITILAAAFQPFVLDRVDSGSIGIKVNLIGDERGVSKYTYKNGWVVYNSWTETLHEFPTYQQHIEYDTLMVITKGGFATKIKPSFNYSLKAATIGDMFMNLRKPIKEVEQGWLLNAIVSSVNDVANRWTVDSIFNSREAFESSIIVECNKRVTQWFSVSQLRSNIIPPPALQAAIINKTKAIQDAQAEDAKALTAEATGRKQVAQAKADSAFRVITAKGEAEASYIEAVGTARAMKEKQQQLTPLYVDYIRASNWNGVLPTTVLGSNSSTLMQLK